MRMLLTDFEDPNTLVVFYISCSICNEVVCDYEEFFNYSEDYRKNKIAEHTEKTTHDSFSLGSIVRNYMCGECGGPLGLPR